MIEGLSIEIHVTDLIFNFRLENSHMDFKFNGPIEYVCHSFSNIGGGSCSHRKRQEPPVRDFEVELSKNVLKFEFGLVVINFIINIQLK
jgi:hypothetical protein